MPGSREPGCESSSSLEEIPQTDKLDRMGGVYQNLVLGRFGYCFDCYVCSVMREISVQLSC